MSWWWLWYNFIYSSIPLLIFSFVIVCGGWNSNTKTAQAFSITNPYQQGSSSMSSTTTSPSSELLSKTYQNIATKTLETVDTWPNSKTLLSLLPQNETNGKYYIPTFLEHEAPLGVAAILHRSLESALILEQCDKIFEQLCKDLHQIFNDNTMEEDDDSWYWKIPKGTHHITVAIFHEHPTLLHNPTDKGRWKVIAEDMVEQLYDKIVNHFKQKLSSLPTPTLTLDSVLLTPDGAMIAGFIDTTGSFPIIRSEIINIAHNVLGDLTSRPKNLIHATVGRILHLPTLGLSKEQQMAVADLVRRYNTQILPEMVKSIHQSTNVSGNDGDGTFTLTELTMLRDITWTLRKYKEYGSWRL